MSITDILDTAQYVVDKHGHQTAVLLDLKSWDVVRHLLEDMLEDERLGQLMIAVEHDEKLEGQTAHDVYRAYLAETKA